MAGPFSSQSPKSTAAALLRYLPPVQHTRCQKTKMPVDGRGQLVRHRARQRAPRACVSSACTRRLGRPCARCSRWRAHGSLRGGPLPPGKSLVPGSRRSCSRHSLWQLRGSLKGGQLLVRKSPDPGSRRSCSRRRLWQVRGSLNNGQIPQVMIPMCKNPRDGRQGHPCSRRKLWQGLGSMRGGQMLQAKSPSRKSPRRCRRGERRL
mmetsp:Transcript_124705/g.399527  ORF Transcript_124705/g.399527 Transcript_124705/m.399527 type:complete len:206 (-) Transcript_124705:539-1156(-)